MNSTLYHRAKHNERVIALLFSQKQIRARLVKFARGPRFFSYDLQLFDALQLDAAIKLSENLALQSASKAVLAHRDGGIIRYDFELRRRHWQTVTRGDVSGLQIGLASGNRPIDFTFKNGGHSLAAGTTGSGKSVLLQSIVCGLVSEFEPEDLTVYVADPHGDFDKFVNLAHLGMDIANTRLEIMNLVTAVYNEFLKRKAENNRDAKRLVLVMDESQDEAALGSSATKHNTETLGMMADLAHQGRKFNVNLVLGSQRPGQKDLPGIYDMLNNRFIGYVDNASTGAIISGQAGLNAHKLSGEGDMLAKRARFIDRFQVAMPRREDFDRLPRVGFVAPVPVDIAPLDNRFPDEVTPGPSAECLDNADFIGWYLANKLPGRVQANRELGISQHMHRRYIEHVRGILQAVAKYRSVA